MNDKQRKKLQQVLVNEGAWAAEHLVYWWTQKGNLSFMEAGALLWKIKKGHKI